MSDPSSPDPHCSLESSLERLPQLKDKQQLLADRRRGCRCERRSRVALDQTAERTREQINRSLERLPVALYVNSRGDQAELLAAFCDSMRWRPETLRAKAKAG